MFVLRNMKKRMAHNFTIMICVFLIIVGAAPAAWAKGKVFVLCYHSFLGNNLFAGDISLQELSRQLDFFHQRGFRFVSFKDLQMDRVHGNRNILISIDDGYQSVYQAWENVFKPRNIYPLLGIYPAIIGKTKNALNWKKLRELAQGGCDIGAHGFNHASLSENLFKEDTSAFIEEIYSSKEILEKKLGKKVMVFIYPKGVRTDVAKDMLGQAGYSCAFSITWAPVLSPVNRNADPYDLGRYMIYDNNWDILSKAILNEASGQDP